MRTTRFQSTFYPDCLPEWETLDPEIRESCSVNVFKKQLLRLTCLPSKSVYGIHDPKRLSILTQLHVGLSKLNFHKFKHNIWDTINKMMVFRIRNTFCCSAMPMIHASAIFLTALMQYCIFMACEPLQTNKYCKYSSIAMKSCLFTQIETFLR